MRVRNLLLVVLLVATAAAVPSPAYAAAAHAVSCGETLTGDGFLDADLTCPNDGLILAGDVTLDLRGHTLRGSGTALKVVGLVSPTVEHGRIAGWRVGLTTDQATADDPSQSPSRSVQLRTLTFASNGTAVDVNNTGQFPFGYVQTTFDVQNSSFSDNQDGIVGVFTGPVVVRRSQFRGNDRALSIDTGSFDLARTSFGGNHQAVRCVESSCSIARSALRHNDTGVSVTNAGLDLTSSILTRSDTGLDISTGLGVHLKHNVFLKNTTAINAVQVSGDLSDNWFGLNHVGYTSSDGGGDFVATLTHNTFGGNYNGIYTADPGTGLKNNFAVHNQHWGIFAPQATDLGGNRAYGNGKSPQCLGVSC